ADEAARGLDAEHLAVLDAKAGRLAILYDVDAARIRRARIAPGHGVVTNGAAARLQEGATDGKAGIVEIGKRNQPAHAFAVEKLGIDAGKTHGIGAADIV